MAPGSRCSLLIGRILFSTLAVLLFGCQTEERTLWDNPLDAAGTSHHPPSIRIASDSVFQDVHGVTLHAEGKSENSSIVLYRWMLRNDTGSLVLRDSTTSDTWKPANVQESSYMLTVQALDAHGLPSGMDSIRIRVRNPAPILLHVSDTSLPANVRLSIPLSAKDSAGSIAAIHWGTSPSSLRDSSRTVVLAPGIVCTQTVYWRARDNLGKTVTDSFRVRFVDSLPVLRSIPDTTVLAGSLVQIVLAASDRDGSIRQYLFDTAGGKWDSAATAPTLRLSSPIEVAKWIRWAARDDVGGLATDSFLVTFSADRPVPIQRHDTIISASSSLAFTLRARSLDPSGSVEKYFWSTSLKGWSDSSANGSGTLSLPVGGTIQVRWMARNTRGAISATDTFVANFLPPPSHLAVHVDTTLADWNGSTGVQFLSWSGSIVGFPRDTVKWSLWLGDRMIHTGLDCSWRMDGLYPGSSYKYRLVGRNRFGDSAEISGQFVAGSPRTNGIRWNASVRYGRLVDERDGKTYLTVVIGDATWMAENLDYRSTTGERDTVGQCLASSGDSCVKYGRLYRWSEAMANANASTKVPSGIQGICPTGWHIPSDAEWDLLTIALGGELNGGTKLRSLDGWQSTNGSDDYGFRAIPSGYYDVGGLGDMQTALWWKSTNSAIVVAQWSNFIDYGVFFTSACSIRCVKDP